MIRRLIFLPIKMFFAITFIAGLVLGWHVLSGGFSQNKISPSSDLEGELFVDSTPVEKISKILNQPFFFLDKGNQAYVFSSKDNEYVLKIIRVNKYQKPLWAKLFPNSQKAIRIQSHKEKNWKDSLLSYLTSSKALQKPSQTIYTHLKQTNNHKGKTVVITDHIGRKWELDLDKHLYIIQKKARSTLSKALMEKKESQDMKGAQKIIYSLKATLEEMSDKGFYLRAKNCFKNLGVKDDKVQIIDLGGLKPLNADNRHPDRESLFSSYEHHLVKWADKHFPELVSIVRENLDGDHEEFESKEK